MISPNSGEEIFEWRENFVGDVPVDNPQHIGNRAAPEPFWGALAEAYVTGCCEIHAHFRASTVEGGILGDWCAFVKKAKRISTSSMLILSGTKNVRVERLFRVTAWGSRCLSSTESLLSCQRGVATEPVPSLV